MKSRDFYQLRDSLRIIIMVQYNHGSVIKNPPASTGDAGSIPGSGRSPGEGNGNSLQYSCLENPMDKGVWRATVHGVRNGSDTR